MRFFNLSKPICSLSSVDRLDQPVRPRLDPLDLLPGLMRPIRLIVYTNHGYLGSRFSIRPQLSPGFYVRVPPHGLALPKKDKEK
jgi:hypothetical protein